MSTYAIVNVIMPTSLASVSSVLIWRGRLFVSSPTTMAL